MMYAATIKAMLGNSMLSVFCPVAMDIRLSDTRLVSQQISSLTKGTTAARTLKVQRQLGKKPNTTAEDFPAKTFTKQEIGLKTSSSYRTIPIPDYVFEAILEERKVYEKNRRRRSGTFQDLDYICCSTYGRPRSKDFHWRHYKKLLEDNGLPDIRWHDLRSTFCTILLKNNFNPKAVSQLMGHAKEIITIDVYGDTAEIIEDCLDDLQPFIDEVIP